LKTGDSSPVVKCLLVCAADALVTRARFHAGVSRGGVGALSIGAVRTATIAWEAACLFSSFQKVTDGGTRNLALERKKMIWNRADLE
jgi:hypothetical protein